MKKLIEDDYLFPVFVSIGYDVYGFSEPLYWTDGMTINPDGTIDHEDMLEDMLEEFRKDDDDEDDDDEKEDNDYFDRDGLDLSDDFSEFGVSRTFMEFSENVNDEYLVEVTNNINFALVAYLDELPEEHIHEATLIEAAISAGNFSAKRSFDFAENVFNIDGTDENEIYDALFSDFNEATHITLRALGYSDSAESLRSSIRSAKKYMDSYPDASPYEKIQMLKLATGLKKDDLAKTAIRLDIGTVTYSDLPKASLLSHLSHLET